jgi:hypothetical protein
VVSDDASGGIAKANAIASANAATTFAIRFADNFTANKGFSPHASPHSRASSGSPQEDRLYELAVLAPLVNKFCV